MFDKAKGMEMWGLGREVYTEAGNKGQETDSKTEEEHLCLMRTYILK